jgi:hypothetical protein
MIRRLLVAVSALAVIAGVGAAPLASADPRDVACS